MKNQAYRWFAWPPVWTYDRGWVWLRYVWRRHVPPYNGVPGSCWTWDHTVADPKPSEPYRGPAVELLDLGQ